jgi:predicted alpha/beta hydrolase
MRFKTTQPTMKESIEVQAQDGYPISVTGFVPTTWNGKVVLINSATGVKQRYYSDFALWLSEQGFRVFTYDYRGIGNSKPASLRGFVAYMHEWGILDYHAVLKHLFAGYPEAQFTVIGHSVGGQLIGMSPLSENVDKIVMIGAQTPFWKNFPMRKTMFTFWYFMIPLFTKLFGYFPATKLRLFEDLPAEVALEWARWAKHENFIFDDLPFMKDRFSAIHQTALMVSFSDDELAPIAAVEDLKRHYKNLKWDHWRLKPEDILQNEIGHFGFFKKKFSRALWGETLSWISRQRVGESKAA